MEVKRESVPSHAYSAKPYESVQTATHRAILVRLHSLRLVDTFAALHIRVSQALVAFGRSRRAVVGGASLARALQTHVHPSAWSEVTRLAGGGVVEQWSVWNKDAYD